MVCRLNENIEPDHCLESSAAEIPCRGRAEANDIVVRQWDSDPEKSPPKRN